MTEAIYKQPGESIDYTPTANIAAGEVVQVSDGRAAFAPVAIAAGVKGAVQTSGIVTLPKTANIVLLAGGRAYWDHSANAVHFKRVDDRDFYLGRVHADVAGSATTCTVALNIDPPYDIDALHGGALSVPTGTQAVGGFGFPKVLGGSAVLQLTATSEAQCIDVLSVDKFAKGAKAIIEAIIRPDANGSTSDVDFNIGVANATHATDADAITEHCFFHIDGGSTAINAQSKDGTTTVTATDTTKTISAGSAVANRSEFWIDTRDLENVKLYVDGIRVLSGSAFKLNAATGPFGLLAHIEKVSGTATGKITIDALRARTAQQ